MADVGCAAALKGSGSIGGTPTTKRYGNCGNRPWMVPRSLAASARTCKAVCSSRRVRLTAMACASSLAC
ncbi:hypothetical protein D3C72_2395680 [compost metagenome]